MYFLSVCPIYCIYLSVSQDVLHTVLLLLRNQKKEQNYAKMFRRHTNVCVTCLARLPVEQCGTETGFIPTPNITDTTFIHSPNG